MKTMTITYHASNNCGSFLQAYALQQTIIGRFGVDNMIIDFRSKELIQNYQLFRPFTSLRNLFKNLYSMIHHHSLKLRAERFENARKQYLHLTDSIYEVHEIEKYKEEVHMFLSGSDQIWNTTAPDFSEAFFLPGISNKCAYGVSLGSDCEKVSLSQYAQTIKEFQKVSLREVQGTDEVSKYYHLPMPVVLDPALLLCKEQYDTLLESDDAADSDTASLLDKKWYERKYIFYYSMKYTASGLKKTMELSKKTGLPVITVFTNYHTCRVPHRMKIIFDAGPKEFLRLLSSAEMIATDSYHGTIFSILYHKSFVYVENGEKRDDRIQNLLDCLNIPMSAVSAEAVLNGQCIDWMLTECRLKSLRETSFAFIKQALDAA